MTDMPEVGESMSIKKKKILVVDDEEDMIWTLRNCLNHEALNADILTASSGEEALEIMKETPVNLVLTDIRMSGMSGLDLMLEIRERWSSTPVIVMTAFPSPEYKSEVMRLGGLHYIEKPFDIVELRQVVSEAVNDDRSFAGTVVGVSLSDIVQVNCLSQATAALEVTASDRSGTIYFEKGRIVHAESGGETGVEAFYRIMELDGGKISSKKVAKPPEKTINLPCEALIIEAARRRDESGSGQDDGFNLEALEAEDPFPALARADNSGDEQNAEDKGGEETPASGQTIAQEDEMDGNLKDILGEFTTIPGVNTACLVGRDGFLLDSIATVNVDAEMIGAIASSGFGASESMGRQLGKGSMAMTMIEYEQGPVIFSPVGDEAFLVIVADRDSNLGMIRLKIKKHAQEIMESAAI